MKSRPATDWNALGAAALVAARKTVAVCQVAEIVFVRSAMKAVMMNPPNPHPQTKGSTMTLTKRKTLAERLQWTEHDGNWWCKHAGVTLVLCGTGRGRWMVMWDRLKHVCFRVSKADGGLEAAKIKAVIAVQDAMLKQYEAWFDDDGPDCVAIGDEFRRRDATAYREAELREKLAGLVTRRRAEADKPMSPNWRSR